MSVFNDQNRVAASIESILKQTFFDFEFLIINDGSKDKTNEVLDYYKNIDSRIRVFKNINNIGLTKSLNLLISKTATNFVARQDSDDTSTKNRIEIQYEFLKKHHRYDFCVSRAKINNTQKLIPGKSFFLPKKILINFKNPFIHGTLMIRKNSLKKLGYYDENFIYSQDYKLFKDALLNNMKFKYFTKPLYNLNTTNNISINKAHEQKYYAECVKKNLTPNKI